jgi:mannose-1-phosphate guanylyltransferase/mannose-6-phosphate isomerase
VAANLIAAGEEDSTLAVLTADHWIGEASLFQEDVASAMSLAEQSGALVTIGIPPTRPETGYGYLEAGDDGLPFGGIRVARFHEKPSAETAGRYVERGGFYWNGGMFFFTLRSFLDELERANPSASSILKDVTSRLRSGDDSDAAEAFERLPNLSVDYAVMEKASNVAMVPARFKWDDLGAWDALSRSLAPDEHGNVKVGVVETIDVSDCILYNEDEGSVLAALGVRDLIVVRSGNAVLVCDKSQAQRVREIVERIGKDS